jgi:toxin ParE1/3/4
MRLRVTRLAQSDIDRIHDRIALDNPSAALRWVERARKQFKFLAANPGVGELCHDIRPDLRCFSQGNYVTFFRIVEDTLEIVRVIHGRRDVGTLF